MSINSRFPFYLFLLPLFFVFHTALENHVTNLAKEAIILFLIYNGISLVVFGLCRLVFRNNRKAAIIPFIIMAFNLFFGSVHDFLRTGFPGLFITRYSVIVPLFILTIILVYILLKKTKRNFLKTTLILNIVFVSLILLDAGLWIMKSAKSPGDYVPDISTQLKNCDSCPRPDIYMIVADEYAGDKTLNEYFSYNNSAFTNELKKRQFHIVNNPSANYNYTVYSMGSMMNMNYIQHLESSTINQRDMFISRDLLNENHVIGFLKKHGYKTYNHSLFEFDGSTNPVNDAYFIPRKTIFTSQTFVNRIYRDMGFHIQSTETIKKFRRINLHNNVTLDSLTRKIALEKNSTPKFVYTHLAMPHHPYYFDSTGKEAVFDPVTKNYTMGKKEYTSYLVYSNKKLLSLIDHILSNAAQPPIIIVMSDHGYRQFASSDYNNYHFVNINMVYFPNGNYSGFYDGMSNINQFRVLLNSQFNQQLPLLKDSTSFLADP